MSALSSKSTMKDFEILIKLGKGSFGTVFKVRRKTDKNFYVMKTIDISRMDRRGQQESINEVKILASLDCPYIVKYYDSFIENKTLYIIMEFCDKGDLSQAIRSQMGRPISENKIWKYFIQMCLGLEYVHSRKILHRDIKSMNVFLIKDDCLRIGDLGVAKVLDSTAAFAHTMVGTPYYLSPELCEEKPYNVKSDVWALGCVLYELSTLKHPFDALNQATLLLKIIKGSYAPVSSSYSAELRSLVDQCLCKDYRKRPSISTILSKDFVKQKVKEMGIAIPPTSILFSCGPLVKQPAPVYSGPMAVIEEEKNGRARAGKQSEPRASNQISPRVNNQPAPRASNQPAAKIGNAPMPKASENVPAHKINANSPTPRAIAPSKIEPKAVKAPENRPVFENKAGIVNKVCEKAREDDKSREIQKGLEKKSGPSSKNLAMKKSPLELREIEAKLAKHRNSGENPAIYNVQFEPQVKKENKPKDVGIHAKNIANGNDNRIQNKVDDRIANKLGAKANDIKQKVIKPGVQAPHFVPPQRPQNLKPAKKNDGLNVDKSVFSTDDIKEVQQLPDFLKPKNQIKVFKPILLKIEEKIYEMLITPIFEETPEVYFEGAEFQIANADEEAQEKVSNFAETIDWCLTQTGFSTKNLIPVTVYETDSFNRFCVNKATTFNDSGSNSNGESDDELYEVSSSNNSVEDTHEETEEDNGEDLTEEQSEYDVSRKLEKCEKELKEKIRLIEMQKKEITKKIDYSTFEEMYEFFKQKATSQSDDINEEEQNEIQNFMYNRVSIENTDVIFIIYKLFHNESEKSRLEQEISSLQQALTHSN